MENLNEVECTYGDCMWYPTLNRRYTVFYGDLNSGSEVEFEVENESERKRGKDDVHGVIVCKINITKIPECIHEQFKNIVCLHISSCMDIREICRDDFRGLENLKEVAITGTLIEIIPGDLFTDLVHLEVIELLMNKIKYIGRDVFKTLKKIAYIDLGLNVKINAIFVGDPYEFPEGIDNSTRCETLEKLNKLISKMKPIKANSRRKSTFSKVKGDEEATKSTPKSTNKSSSIGKVDDTSISLPNIDETTSDNTSLNDQPPSDDSLVTLPVKTKIRTRSKTIGVAPDPPVSNKITLYIDALEPKPKKIAVPDRELFPRLLPHVRISNNKIIKYDPLPLNDRIKIKLLKKPSENEVKSEKAPLKFKIMSPVSHNQAVAPITIIKKSMVMTKLNDSGEKKAASSPRETSTEDLRTIEIKDIISSITSNCKEDESAQCSKKARISLGEEEEEEVKNGEISLQEEAQDGFFYETYNEVNSTMADSDLVDTDAIETSIIHSNEDHPLKIDSAESLEDKIENGVADESMEVEESTNQIERFDFQNDIEEIVVEEISMEDFKPYDVDSSPDNSTADFQYQNYNQSQDQSSSPRKSIDYQGTLRSILTKPLRRRYSESPNGLQIYEFPSLDACKSSSEDSPTKDDQPASSLNTSPADLIVKINQTEFNVHKSTFASRSLVFAEKLASKPNLKKIEMKFVSVEVFTIIYDFIYMSKLPPRNFEVIEEVFKQSTLLKIDDLREITSKMLIQMLDYDKAMTIFQIGNDYNDAEMKSKAFDVVKKILPGQVEKEEQMSDLLILKELVKAKYLRKRKIDEGG